MLDEERKRNVIKVWTDTKNEIESEIKLFMDKFATTNHIFMMADSGARGSSSNFTQLAGMRGLMAKPNGESMEIPIKSNFREGLSMSEFFTSTHGARKGSTDTALKTAESGYLTRRLVDVSHDVTITSNDCHTDKGMIVTELVSKDKRNTIKLKDRIVGRFTSKQVKCKDANGKEVILAERNQFIDEKLADKIVEAGVKEVEIRTLLTCDCKVGVCVKCYGSDLSTNEIVEKGEVVGVVAAQSIGEPGTQLTMRTFHSGGVAGDDITQGLPRIQELFEARTPKGKGIISEVAGTVVSVETNPLDHRTKIEIESNIPDNNKTYQSDSGKKAVVKVGDKVSLGQPIVEGLVHTKELINVGSVEDVEHYILNEVQQVYGSQGVAIADKHVEIIIKQMLQKCVVIDEGDSELLPGMIISRSEMYKTIKEHLVKSKRPPVVKPIILGITRASLKADSFLSSASFQETTRVLTEAAIRSKRDYLEGLKENIIIGGLVPAGTGLVDKGLIGLDTPIDAVKYQYEENK